MVTSITREKCLRDLGDVVKSAGWALSLIALNEIGLADDGKPTEGFDLLSEATEEIDDAMESLKLVRAYLEMVRDPLLARAS